MIQTSLFVILIFLFVGITSVTGANYMYEKDSIRGINTTNNSTYTSCPSGCTCMGEKNALNQGRVYCFDGVKQTPCGINQLGENMYCYSDTIPATTTLPTAFGRTLTPTPSITITASPTTSATGNTVVLSNCGADCRCILPDAASSLGLLFCGGSPVLCNYDTSGRGMYCYALAQQTTQPMMPGTSAVTPAPVSCSRECTCLDPATANQIGLTLCGGTPVLCNYDSNRNPMYCYYRAGVSSTDRADGKSSAAGIPLCSFTVLGAVGTLILISGLSSIKKK
jgi:hypothetical protein